MVSSLKTTKNISAKSFVQKAKAGLAQAFTGYSFAPVAV